MQRSDRLRALLGLLQDGQLHTAGSLAENLSVSVRTIYRDMDVLMASGVPVEGARGVGYRATGQTTIPPMTLTPEELEALNLGIAIVAEAADPKLSRAALSLGDKLDALMPSEAIPEAESWQFATYPFADTARGLGHMPTIRSAIKARQKLQLQARQTDGSVGERTIRPLRLAYYGRVWILTAWCELSAGFQVFRLDLIESATALPEIFTDEPGKTLADYTPR